MASAIEVTHNYPEKLSDDLQQQLVALFFAHPDCTTTAEGVPAIPARVIIPVLASFSQQHGITLLHPTEEQQLRDITTANPNIPVTPDLILEFVAKSTSSISPPPRGPTDSTSFSGSGSDSSDDRGRPIARDPPPGPVSRSSSGDSVVTSYYRPSDPFTPSKSAGFVAPSPFEGRQRSTPLEKAAPSSWARRPQAAFRRRRSSGGGSSSSHALSDTESMSPSTPKYHQRRRPRSRAQSTGPTPPGSPSTQTISFKTRSHSRSTHYDNDDSVPPMSGFSFPARRHSDDVRSSSPDFSYPRIHRPASRNDALEAADTSDPNSLLLSDISYHSSPDSDSDDMDDDERGPRIDDPSLIRSTTTSLASLSDSADRVEALQRANQELGRKLIETERIWQQNLADHENELEDIQLRLEEARSELLAAKREEKELKIKERNNSVQLSTLEAEVSKLQKLLENSRTAYQSLQKQYQEQCAESEKYRSTLRRKDQEIREVVESAALHAQEAQKRKAEYESLEAALESLRDDLEAASQYQKDLDEQKQENLMLKETIDRLRFDLDDMRQSANAAASNPNSVHGTLSKSLANELKLRLDTEEDRRRLEAPKQGETRTSDRDDGEYEETIVTASRRRKVGGRSTKAPDVTTVEEVKEYVDAYTQHDISEFASTASTQTDPPRVVQRITTSIQTDDLPAPSMKSESCIQTDASTGLEPSIPTIRMEAHSPRDAKSSNSITPPTTEPPPAYAHLADDDRQKIGLAVLGKWHPSLTTTRGIPGGISQNTVDEWNALKAELGLDCLVIDQVIQRSEVRGERHDNPDALTMTPRIAKEWGRQIRRRHPEADSDSGVDASGESSPEIVRRTKRQPAQAPHQSRPRLAGNRFYNIYNTYFYPGRRSEETPKQWNMIWFGIGMWAVVIMTASVFPIFPAYGELAHPSDADRQLWAAYNTLAGPRLEGFHGRTAMHSTADAVWHVTEKLLQGAVKAIRRMPT